MLLLRDERDQLPSIDVQNGEVKLNLVPMVAESIRRVVNAGIVAIGGERQIPELTPVRTRNRRSTAWLASSVRICP